MCAHENKTCLVDDLVEDGRHLAEVFRGEDGVEHLALPSMLFSYHWTKLVNWLYTDSLRMHSPVVPRRPGPSIIRMVLERYARGIVKSSNRNLHSTHNMGSS